MNNFKIGDTIEVLRGNNAGMIGIIEEMRFNPHLPEDKNATSLRLQGGLTWVGAYDCRLKKYDVKYIIKQYSELETSIESALRSKVNNSHEESVHVDSKCIKVEIFDYEELVIIQDKLTFIDHKGLQYSLYADCQISDLIEILKTV